jgi:hypothetical protein
MNDFKATDEQWKADKYDWSKADTEAMTGDSAFRCILELRARIEQLEAPANNPVINANASVPEPPTIGGVEDAAKAIYSDAMIWAAANASGGAIPSWVEGGNSTAQDVARQVARSLATPFPARPKPPTDEEIDEWADAPYDVPDEMPSKEELGEYRCFTEKGLGRTIRAALERWGYA